MTLHRNAAAKASLLRAGNLSAPYALSPQALKSDSNLLVALRVIAATPTELQRYADAFGGKTLSERNEIKWRLLLRETAVSLLAEAEEETSADEDRSQLKRGGGKGAGQARPAGVSERRRRAAIVCRLGEKQLLREVLAEIDNGLATLKYVAKGERSSSGGGGGGGKSEGGS